MNSREVVIVYAVQSPTYLSGMFGGCNVLCNDTDGYMLTGSALAICGGYCRQDNGKLFIMPVGTIQLALAEGVGKTFSERAVAQLVKPNDRVTIFIDTFPAKWMGIVKNIGFDVLQSHLGAVCLGIGSMLPEFEWLTYACPWHRTSLFAGQGERSPLEEAIVDRALESRDIGDFISKSWKALCNDPKVMSEELERCNLVVHLGGREYADVFINRIDTDVSGIDCILQNLAKEMDIGLYYAGTLGGLRSTDWFDGWSGWQPLPKNWERKA